MKSLYYPAKYIAIIASLFILSSCSLFLNKNEPEPDYLYLYRITAKNGAGFRQQPSIKSKESPRYHKGYIIRSASKPEKGWLKHEYRRVNMDGSDTITVSYIRSRDIELVDSVKNVKKLGLSIRLKRTEQIYHTDKYSFPYIRKDYINIAALALMLLLFAIYKLYEHKKLSRLLILMLIPISLIEIYYILMDKSELSWFLRDHRIGFFGTVFCWLGFALYLGLKSYITVMAFNNLNRRITTKISWAIGVIMTIIGALAWAILIELDSTYKEFFLIFGGLQLLFCMYVVYCCISNKRIIECFVLPILYLLIMAPLFILGTEFMLSFIYVFIVLGILFLGSVGARTVRNRNAVEYIDGSRIVTWYGNNECKTADGRMWERGSSGWYQIG